MCISGDGYSVQTLPTRSSARAHMGSSTVKDVNNSSTGSRRSAALGRQTPASAVKSSKTQLQTQQKRSLPRLYKRLLSREGTV